jgi:hypothetical protein
MFPPDENTQLVRTSQRFVASLSRRAKAAEQRSNEAQLLCWDAYSRQIVYGRC